MRGRSLPSRDLAEHLDAGIGWVPANHSLTPLGTLAEESPFGSTGDLRLLPDSATHTRVAAGDAAGDGGRRGAVALELVLCDIVETDGAPWSCCPRHFLRDALRQLDAELGVRVRASFEHEFQLLDEREPALPFSLEAQRRAEPFPSLLMAALGEAGLEPERIFAEYAPHQFEVPVAACEAEAAADRAVILREITREVARRCGRRATFAPLLDPATAGNGVHIHFALLDEAGRNVLYDADRPEGLSERGGSFAAGILKHARALSALTAPSPVSASRLTPHRWSAGAVCLAARNREALLRIPPLVELSGREPGEQLRLEYRGADATANPHLALGALLRAGLEGVRAGLPAPELLESDPGELDPGEAERFGVGSLPASLSDSLEALAADSVAREWLAGELYEAYVGVKRAEVAAAAELELEEVCRRYAGIY